jgi:type VI secretion system protein ImpF
MMRIDNQTNLVSSILDRLLDDQPEEKRYEPLHSRFQNLRQLKQAVARDLEALLNTRREALEEVPPEFAEVRRSLLNYGLPDFASFNPLR